MSFAGVLLSERAILVRECRRLSHLSWPLARLPAPPTSQSRKDRSRPLHIVAAKKGKGGGKKGGGGQQKGPGSLMDIPKPPEPWNDPEIIMENLLLIESFRRKVGRPLLEGELEIQEIAESLWKAPMAILSSNDGDSDGEPPVYNYANEAALSLMGFEKLEDVIGSPCSATAGNEQALAARGELMGEVLEKGSMEVGPLKRQTPKGEPVELLEATLWAVEAPTGETLGSAIAIYKWIGSDGKEGGPRSEAPSAEDSAEHSASVPPEDLAAAEASAAEQAQVVRDLKESKGLGNSSPEVQAAVDELLERKAVVERLK
ncbi:hypothetical protein WJX84_001135 [Apatococcus fuscideae]|uniref:WHEP-TRS domain-containing protein n=1 Tax=Apatococcus fuscideae TaxID=2026836 RepID=A0AAW1SAE5_9CHLO